MTTGPDYLTMAETQAVQRRQRVRNWILLVVLVLLVVLFYAISVVRLKVT